MGFVRFIAICLVRLEFIMGFARAEVSILSSPYCTEGNRLLIFLTHSLIVSSSYISLEILL